MRMDECRELFTYDEWANGRTFTALAELTKEEWAREVGGSFGSIRGTAAHLVGAEWVWLERWRGATPEHPPQWLTDPTVVQLREVLSKIEADRGAWLAPLSDADLGERREYRLLDGTRRSARLAIQLRHLVNHSTYHRGQLATLLRMVGKVPPGTDLVLWDSGR
jgi:uncharacterized damage-inducible protein DinB